MKNKGKRVEETVEEHHVVLERVETGKGVRMKKRGRKGSKRLTALDLTRCGFISNIWRKRQRFEL